MLRIAVVRERSSLSSQNYDTFILARREQVLSWKGTVYRALAHWHQIADVQIKLKGATTSQVHFHAGIPICNISRLISPSDANHQASSCSSRTLKRFVLLQVSLRLCLLHGICRSIKTETGQARAEANYRYGSARWLEPNSNLGHRDQTGNRAVGTRSNVSL